jgi:hypothetical protein
MSGASLGKNEMAMGSSSNNHSHPTMMEAM